MRAMILAAGRGARMRELTEDSPKPLLEVAGRSLIEHQVSRLVAAGFEELVINLSYLGEAIRRALGDGRGLGARIEYSDEGARMLGTGGGVARALPRLGERFVLVNADLWTDYPFERLRSRPPALAHLVLVDNPPHVPEGNYALDSGRVSRAGGARLTYSGIALLSTDLFAAQDRGVFALTEPLDRAAARGEVTGEHYRGCWADVGTPERLATLRGKLAD